MFEIKGYFVSLNFRLHIKLPIKTLHVVFNIQRNDKKITDTFKAFNL